MQGNFLVCLALALTLRFLSLRLNKHFSYFTSFYSHKMYDLCFTDE